MIDPRPLSAAPLLLAALIGMVGCLAEHVEKPPLGPGPQADAGTAPPAELRRGPPLPGFARTLFEQPADFAVELSDGRVLAGAPHPLLIDAAPERLDGEVGPLVGAAVVDGHLLVAGQLGLFVATDRSLERSPLSAALDTGAPVALLAAGERLWIGTERGLHLWQGGDVYQIRPAGLSTRRPRLAASPGAGPLWVASAADLYAVALEGADPIAQPEVTSAPVVGLAVDGTNTSWIVSEDGALASRLPDGTWRHHRGVEGARRVEASRERAEVWIEGMEGLFRQRDGELRLVTGLGDATLLAAAADGSALVSTEAGLQRLWGERAVELVGLRSGALLSQPTIVSIRPVAANEVTSIEARLNAAPVELGTPWSVALDPEALADGAHLLEVEARYEDGAVARAELRFVRFRGPPPTWRDDVEPLFLRSCAVCHGAAGGARRLDTPETWRSEIELILYNLETGRMPLPPVPELAPDEVARVVAWRAAGFPVEGE